MSSTILAKKSARILYNSIFSCFQTVLYQTFERGPYMPSVPRRPRRWKSSHPSLIRDRCTKRAQSSGQQPRIRYKFAANTDHVHSYGISFEKKRERERETASANHRLRGAANSREQFNQLSVLVGFGVHTTNFSIYRLVDRCQVR